MVLVGRAGTLKLTLSSNADVSFSPEISLIYLTKLRYISIKLIWSKLIGHITRI